MAESSSGANSYKYEVRNYQGDLSFAWSEQIEGSWRQINAEDFIDISPLDFTGWRKDLVIPDIVTDTEALGCLASRNILFTGSYLTEGQERFPDELELCHNFKLNHVYEVQNGWKRWERNNSDSPI